MMSTPLTKVELLDSLRSDVASAGGEVHHLSGDCYVATADSEPRFAVALKASDAPAKMWVGCPEPLLHLLGGRYALQAGGHSIRLDVARIRIALIHRPAKTLVIIEMGRVFEAIADRAAANRARVELSFDVIRLGWRKYSIKSTAFREDIAISTFGLEPLLELFRRPIDVSAG